VPALAVVAADLQKALNSLLAIKPRDVPRLAKLGESAVSILGIASCHGNGYVRAEAVRELGKIRNGSELPFLLIRVNDWVDVNRQSARELILARARTDYAQHLVTWLPLVLRLKRIARTDQSDLMNVITSVLEDPQVRPALSSVFESADRYVRWFCYERALNRTAGADLDVLQRALSDTDPYVRGRALGKLQSILPNEAFRSLLSHARHDPNMSVRREALQLSAEKYPGDAESEFRSALLDPNAAIREAARYFLAKNGSLDFRAFYLERLDRSAGREQLAAIHGLGETGGATDSQFLERFFQSPSPRIRLAAVRGIANLNSDAYTNEFLLSLKDSSPRVAREAAIVLTKKANSVGGKRLSEVFEQCAYRHGKRLALFLIARVSKWDNLIFLLLSLSEKDESLLDLSRTYLARWLVRYNRSFSTPTADQLTRLRTILEERQELLNSGTRTQLGLILKNFPMG
jgi:HEAT repeat protein